MAPNPLNQQLITAAIATMKAQKVSAKELGQRSGVAERYVIKLLKGEANSVWGWNKLATTLELQVVGPDPKPDGFTPPEEDFSIDALIMQDIPERVRKLEVTQRMMFDLLYNHTHQMNSGKMKR